jgi:hypothetical protein
MWWKLTQDLFAANLEAHQVIALRMTKLAKGGPGAKMEASLMFTEKMAATVEAAHTLALGGSPETVLQRYRTIMRANAKRLSKPRHRR